SDPAAVFGDADTLYLAVRSRADQTIQLAARSNGTWSDLASLGTPAARAASAPTLATLNGSLDVFVRGGDGVIYWRPCPDAPQRCAAGGSGPDAWVALAKSSSGTFVGKPSAFWSLDKLRLMVAAVSADRVPFVIYRTSSGWLPWLQIDSLD